MYKGIDALGNPTAIDNNYRGYSSSFPVYYYGAIMIKFNASSKVVNGSSG